jgi:hypothetical protein
MKYVVIHKPSGEEVDPGDVIYDPLHDQRFRYVGISRTPEQCAPHQAPKVLVEADLPFVGIATQVERYAHGLQLEVVPVRVERFQVTVTRGPQNDLVFTENDLRYALNEIAFPNSVKDGSLQFDVQEVQL